jgi:predicted RNase H-like nuclease (RuvC/YqgF family)
MSISISFSNLNILHRLYISVNPNTNEIQSFNDKITNTLYIPSTNYEQLKKEVEESKKAIQKLKRNNKKLLRKIQNNKKIEKNLEI